MTYRRCTSGGYCATLTNRGSVKRAQKELEAQIRKTSERKVADRLRVVLYKAIGRPNQEIAQLLQMSRNRVTKLLRRYQAGGLEALVHPAHYRGSAPRLTVAQQQALKIELTTHIYVTAWQVIAWIERLRERPSVQALGL